MAVKTKKLPVTSPLKIEGPGCFYPMEKVFADAAFKLCGHMDIYEKPNKVRYDIVDWFYSCVLTGFVSSVPVDDVTMPVMLGRYWRETKPLKFETDQFGLVKTRESYADVLIITNKVIDEEFESNRFPGGSTREYLAQQFAMNDLEFSDWYVTSLIKHMHPDWERGGSTLKKSWAKEFYPIVEREIAFIQPSIIYAFGVEPTQFILRDVKAKMGDVEGRTFYLNWPKYENFRQYRRHEGVFTDENVTTFPIKVVCMTHPRVGIRSKEAADKQKLTNSINQMIRVYKGVETEETVDHFAVYTIEELKALKERINNEIEDNLIGIDAEWNGDHPQNHDWYVRSIQLSWKPNTAAAIMLHNEKGRCIYEPEEYKEAISIITEILNNKQLTGHYFDADMEHIEALGIPVLKMYSVPDNWKAYKEAVLSDQPCGFDTALAAHAVEETDSFALTPQYMKHTNAPRYDVDIEEWYKNYKAYCKKTGQDAPSGYGPIPDALLVPYGCYDADVTRRIALKLRKLLSADRFNHDCWEPFWRNMRVIPVVMEIKVTGLYIDKEHMKEMMQVYAAKLHEMLQIIKKYAGYDSFNTNSRLHLMWFLFGMGKKPIVESSEEAFTMGLAPAYETGLKPRTWADVILAGDENRVSPSCSQKALSFLINGEDKQVCYRKENGEIALASCKEPLQLLKNISAVKQILRTVLRLPDNEVNLNDDDVMEDASWEKGLPSFICDDSRVRTTIYTTKETGRWSSARPPLQNISKTKEVLYESILGDSYAGPLRSVIKADPGYVLISTDFSGAELTAAAILSQDRVMLDNVTRNQLDEDDPNFYDIHSNIAVSAFHLDCPATKHGLKEAGVYHYRHLAKSVIFGLMYGRGAKAISVAAQEEGIEVTQVEAQKVIDAVYNRYPNLRLLFDGCKERVAKNGWLRNAWGRYRRFFPYANTEELASNSREAMNFPVQSFVADAANGALCAMYYQRNDFPGVDYKIALQIHDEVVSLVKIDSIDKYLHQVIPKCMRDAIPLYGSDLTGKRYFEGPYYFGNDSTIYKSWGIALNDDDLKQLS